MFSKKFLRITLLGLIAQLVYMSVDSIHPALIRPILLLAGIGVGVLFYFWQQGYFTEEKIVEKIAEHRDEPLADLHKPNASQKPINKQQIQPIPELQP